MNAEDILSESFPNLNSSLNLSSAPFLQQTNNTVYSSEFNALNSSDSNQNFLSSTLNHSLAFTPSLSDASSSVFSSSCLCSSSSCSADSFMSLESAFLYSLHEIKRLRSILNQNSHLISSPSLDPAASSFSLNVEDYKHLFTSYRKLNKTITVDYQVSDNNFSHYILKEKGEEKKEEKREEKKEETEEEKEEETEEETEEENEKKRWKMVAMNAEKELSIVKALLMLKNLDSCYRDVEYEDMQQNYLCSRSINESSPRSLNLSFTSRRRTEDNIRQKTQRGIMRNEGDFFLKLNLNKTYEINIEVLLMHLNEMKQKLKILKNSNYILRVEVLCMHKELDSYRRCASNLSHNALKKEVLENNALKARLNNLLKVLKHK